MAQLSMHTTLRILYPATECAVNNHMEESTIIIVYVHVHSVPLSSILIWLNSSGDTTGSFQK